VTFITISRSKTCLYSHFLLGGSYFIYIYVYWCQACKAKIHIRICSEHLTVTWRVCHYHSMNYLILRSIRVRLRFYWVRDGQALAFGMVFFRSLFVVLSLISLVIASSSTYASDLSFDIVKLAVCVSFDCLFVLARLFRSLCILLKSKV